MTQQRSCDCQHWERIRSEVELQLPACTFKKKTERKKCVCGRGGEGGVGCVRGGGGGGCTGIPLNTRNLTQLSGEPPTADTVR